MSETKTPVKPDTKKPDNAPDEKAVQQYDHTNGAGTAIAKASSPTMVIADPDSGELPDQQ